MIIFPVVVFVAITYAALIIQDRRITGAAPAISGRSPSGTGNRLVEWPTQDWDLCAHGRRQDCDHGCPCPPAPPRPGADHRAPGRTGPADGGQAPAHRPYVERRH